MRRPHLPQRVQSENLPGPSLRGPRTKTFTDCFLKLRRLGFKRLKKSMSYRRFIKEAKEAFEAYLAFE